MLATTSCSSRVQAAGQWSGGSPGGSCTSAKWENRHLIKSPTRDRLHRRPVQAGKFNDFLGTGQYKRKNFQHGQKHCKLALQNTLTERNFILLGSSFAATTNIEYSVAVRLYMELANIEILLRVVPVLSTRRSSCKFFFSQTPCATDALLVSTYRAA
jgi:hypothetical protein